MHHDADHIGQQAAASGADAIEGEPGGTSHMQPLGLAADAKACLVHRVWKKRPELQAHWRTGIQSAGGLPVAAGRRS